ncbi:hypothetical protein GE061_009414 [Apolygus lucorum]|uniref:C2H2-type domain-containing protein n=1 Tax=Apolygus lucorum TaxID=248454 RepID=A0A8S9Y286_APOLU|nr:hypothetical protein GE061_009414 [Apolygus lucorum]
MVKLQKGKGNHNKGGKPRPLFPPGELPLFGPPPAYVRRPAGPPPPPPRAPRPRPMPLGFGPPLPPGPPGPRRMPPPPLMGPPRPPHGPPPPPPMRRRGPPGPLMPPPPMMLHPMMNPHGPPPPPHFLRGPPRRPLMGPPFRGRIDKMGPNNRRMKPNNNKKKKLKNKSKAEIKTEAKPDDLLTGPWINDAIKGEIEKMNELKKVADEKKETEDVEKYSEQKKIVEELAKAAKQDHAVAQAAAAAATAQSKAADAPTTTTTTDEPMADDNQGDFLCETCDRSWETQEELEEHVGTHVVCGTDGCTFTAHPKVVDLHFKMQHATGLYHKIPKTSDSKEIEAWIAERKKRYPTKERLDALNAEKQEKIARGEVLEDPTTQPKLSSTPKDIRSNKNTTQKKLSMDCPPDYEANKKAAIEAAEKAASATPEEPIEENNISDEEWETEAPSADTSKNMCSVLSALSAAYDSNISDEDGPPTEMKAVVTRDELPLEDSPNKNDPASSKQIPETATDKNPRKRARKRPVKEDAKRPKKPLPPPSSLLQKLLVKEIRKERNQILQCVRYIVENNYFENPTKLPAKTAIRIVFRNLPVE